MIKTVSGNGKKMARLRNTYMWQQTKTRTTLPHVFLATSVFFSYCLVNFLAVFYNTDTATLTSGAEEDYNYRIRFLLSVNESQSKRSGQYPEEVFTLEQKRDGAVILHIIGMCYMFLALSIACDEFFIPVLAVITEKLNISEDIAGATFMAAGGSMPELCTSFVGTFADPESNVGFGTIVGSAVFNVLFVIGMCAVFSKEILKLTWWPLFRDCMFYIVALVILIVFFRDSEIEWWESLTLLVTYIVYVTFMKFNHSVERWVKDLLKSNKVDAIDSKGSETCNPGVNKGDMALEKALENLCLSSARQNEPPSFRHGALQLVIHSIDPLGDASIAVKVNKLKRLRCLRVRVGMNKENKSAHGNLNPAKSVFPDDNNRQFQLPVVNSSMNVQAVYEDSGNSAYMPSLQSHSQESSNLELQKSDINYNEDANRESYFCRTGEAVNGELPTVRVYSNENGQSPVPGMCQQQLNRTSVASQGSLSSTVLPYSSNQHLIDIENAREACLDDNVEPLDLSWPGGWKDRLVYVIRAPVIFLMYFTALDVRKPERRRLYPWSFFWSVFWIAWFSYFMVWWAKEVGETLHIPSEVMGLTFLAAGTSIPDLITSVLVARKGFGDMAVSSSIGSNMFDITIGLPLPWVIFSAVHQGKAVAVSSTSLFCSVFLLFLMLLAVIITIAINKWKMSKLLGATMFLLYVVFLVVALLLQYDVIKCFL